MLISRKTLKEIIVTIDSVNSFLNANSYNFDVISAKLDELISANNERISILHSELTELSKTLETFTHQVLQSSSIKTQNEELYNEKLESLKELIRNIIVQHMSKLENQALQQGFSVFNVIDNKFEKINNIDKSTQSVVGKLDEITNNINHVIYLCHKNKQKFYFYKEQTEATFLNLFMEYVDTHDLPAAYIRLKKGLDEQSIVLINRIINRVIKRVRSNDMELDMLTAEEQEEYYSINLNHWRSILKLSDSLYAYGKYLLPIDHFEISVFYYRHFLDNMNIPRDKHIIDAGGFIGDSMLILSEYTDKKVHVFEPMRDNYDLLLKTIELNEIKNSVPNNLALGSKKESRILNSAGSSSSMYNKLGNCGNQEALVITLDSYVQTNNLEVGLIKTDLEGSELDFLKGAEQTIRMQKPLLIISIYHTGSDFFEIKPLIESWDLGYKFCIKRPVDGQILLETVLICEPE